MRRVISALIARAKDARRLGLRVALGPLGAGPIWSVKSKVGDLCLRVRESDLLTFRQVFSNREYDIGDFPQEQRLQIAYESLIAGGGTPVILDAGANVGAASVWFARKFPHAIVLAVEPAPGSAEMARLNTRALPNIRVVEAAIGSAPGTVELTSDDRDQLAWAIQTRRCEGGGVRVVTVRQCVESCGAGATLFLVKIDIEGFESDLFARDTDWLDEVCAVFIEPHDWMLPDGKTSRGFQREFARRDFDLLVTGENLVYAR